MIYQKLPCDEASLDRFAGFYLDAASALEDRFGMRGRAAVRDAVRMFAKKQAAARREFLIQNGVKPNLKNIFTLGGPLPCGTRCDKEWIRVTPEEVFVNVARCPYADCWNSRGRAQTGKMFCEEFYPAYLHAAASEKAQINLGRVLVNEGDSHCRLSVYLRPANLPEEERASLFDAFDTDLGPAPGDPPIQPADYDAASRALFECLCACAGERLGEEGLQAVRRLGEADPIACASIN